VKVSNRDNFKTLAFDNKGGLEAATLLDRRRVSKPLISRILANFDEMACRRERFWPMIRFTIWQNHHNEWPTKAQE
jgi:hypothetical protein